MQISSSSSQRRGILIPDLLKAAKEDGEGKLPLFRLSFPEGDKFFWNEEAAREFASSKELRLDDLENSTSNGNVLETAMLRELHENAELQSLFGELAEHGIDAEDWDLVREESVTGDHMATRFAWIINKGTEQEEIYDLANVPDILEGLRTVGRRNIELKRFKGLGEMNPEELWDTTMDPGTRTLLKVTVAEGDEANELFMKLMGEDVEPRRAYIEDNALEVKNIDI